MNFLVTGASGFIGQTVVQNLIKRGHHVNAVVRPNSKHKYHEEQAVTCIYSDLLGLSSTHLAGIDIVIHLAASGVSSQESPWNNLLHCNVLGTQHICSLAAIESKPIVITGSAKEYGISSSKYERIPVSAPLEPVTAYAVSKACAYLIASSIAKTTNNTTCYLRIFNAYGPDQNPSGLWPSLRLSAAAGIDFNISNGSQIRDFIHISRVAALIVLFAENTYRLPEPLSLFNIGSGKGQTVSSFCNLWWERLNARGRIIQGSIPIRVDDVDLCVADISNWPSWAAMTTIIISDQD